jgi:hypothetical protein
MVEPLSEEEGGGGRELTSQTPWTVEETVLGEPLPCASEEGVDSCLRLGRLGGTPIGIVGESVSSGCDDLREDESRRESEDEEDAEIAYGCVVPS